MMLNIEGNKCGGRWIICKFIVLKWSGYSVM